MILSCLVLSLKISVSDTQTGGFLEDFFQKFPHLPFAQVASVQDPSSVFEDLIQPQKRELTTPPSREVKSLPIRPVKRQLIYETTTARPVPSVTTTTIHSMFYRKRFQLNLFLRAMTSALALLKI